MYANKTDERTFLLLLSPMRLDEWWIEKDEKAVLSD